MRTTVMKNPARAGGIVLAACVGACVLASLPALLAGTSLLAIGAAALNEIALAAFAIPVLGLLYLYHRRRSKAGSGADREVKDADNCDCGCDGSSSADVAVSDDEPVACSLDVSSAKQRVAMMRDLSGRALRKVSRNDLVLDLTYAPEVETEVRELVRAEQQCCAFLDFDLRRDEAGVHLRVTAPESARSAAEELFAQFAPHLD